VTNNNYDTASWGEEKGEGRFGKLDIGKLEFIWSLGFGYWDLSFSMMDRNDKELG